MSLRLIAIIILCIALYFAQGCASQKRDIKKIHDGIKHELFYAPEAERLA